MPRIPQYENQTQLKGKLRVDYNPDQFGAGVGSAMQNFGAQLQHLGNQIDAEKERDADLQRQHLLAKAKEEWMLRMEDMKQKAAPGAEGFIDQVKNEFNTYKDSIISQAGTPKAKNNLSVDMDNLGVSMLGHAVEYQHAQGAKLNVNRAKESFDSLINVTRADPRQLDASVAQSDSVLGSLKLDNTSKESLKRSQTGELHFAAANGGIDVAIQNKDKKALFNMVEDLRGNDKWKSTMTDNQYAQTLQRAMRSYEQLNAEESQLTKDWFRDAMQELPRGIGMDATGKLRKQINDTIPDPYEKKKMLMQVDTAEATGRVYAQVKTASATELDNLTKSLEARRLSPGNYSQDAQNEQIVLSEAVAYRKQQILNDRAGYALQTSESVQKEWSNVSALLSSGNADPSALSSGIASYVAASKAEQVRLGVPADYVHYLPAAMVDSLATEFGAYLRQDDGPEKAQQTLVSLSQTWGKHWPEIKRQLISSKVLTGAQAIAADLVDPRYASVSQALLVANGPGMKRSDLVDVVGGETKAKDVQAAVQIAAKPLLETVVRQRDGAQWAAQFNDSVTNLSLYYMGRGMSQGEAVTKAVTAFTGQFNFQDGYRAPKSVDSSLLKLGTLAIRDDIKVNPANIVTPQSLLPGIDEMVGTDMVKELVNKGSWINNGPETGLVMLWPGTNTPVTYKDKDGKVRQLEYTWKELTDKGAMLRDKITASGGTYTGAK